MLSDFNRNEIKNTFSIVICTYNGEKTIEKAIDSVLNLNGFDIYLNELIIVDNASTDSTKDIIYKYISRNKKIKYEYERQSGLSYARRHAIHAISPWVIFVDDDNILDKNWLVELDKTITDNPKVGVINGAVIGVPECTLTEDEKIRFESIYRNLACTHIYEYNENVQVNTQPIGAGMCILTSALIKISENGWLNMIGRQGNKLTSGEDTELCNKVFSLGYDYLCNYSMKMEHIIPKKRLTEEYCEKILISLTQSRYILISQKKHYIIARIARLLKHTILYLTDSCRKANTKQEQEIIKQNKIISLTYIKCILNDHIIKRKK